LKASGHWLKIAEVLCGFTYIQPKQFIMHKIIYSFLLVAGLTAMGLTVMCQGKKTPDLRPVLLEQFRETYTKQEWFVPVMKALDGVTAKQAMWKPSDSSHSVGELAYHILYWNKEQLDKFYGRKPAAYSGNNNETFTAFTEDSWASTVQQLDQVMKGWETAIGTADETKLKAWYGIIARINTHTAYHTGQILYIRKLAGNWDSGKGVK
jgi:DinB superfamily